MIDWLERNWVQLSWQIDGSSSLQYLAMGVMASARYYNDIDINLEPAMDNTGTVRPI